MANETAYSTKSDFDRQVSRMFGNWESSVRDRGIASEKKAELRRTYDRVGPTRFGAGVDAALRGHGSGFFPTIAEFEDFIPSFAGERHTQTCEMCSDTGWPGHIKTECQHPPSCQQCNGSARYVAWRTCRHGAEVEDYRDYQDRG